MAVLLSFCRSSRGRVVCRPARHVAAQDQEAVWLGRSTAQQNLNNGWDRAAGKSVWRMEAACNSASSANPAATASFAAGEKQINAPLNFASLSPGCHAGSKPHMWLR